MIIKKCIICIGGTHFLDAKLTLTEQRADALAFSGKRTSKKMVKYLKSKGAFNISIIEL
jgi:hypothetical protein